MIVSDILQVIIALGIYNVWIVRFNKATNYRGGDAKNLIEEFAVYGLSRNIAYLIGFLKLTAATLLLVGIWINSIIVYPAALMAVLMIGAISMHIKVKDPLLKGIPATLMLIMSVTVLLLNL